MLLLLDNYDSFVHNLARYCEELGCNTQVLRSDATTISEIRGLVPQALILSPGPCTPAEAGICLDVVRQLGGSIPMLGVCLGHQVIAAALGGRVIRAAEPVHARTSLIQHDASSLFDGLPNPLRATRYHSLIAERDSLPVDLRVTATCEGGLVMGLEHRSWPVYGVQFHPESILTEHGHALVANFLRLAGLHPVSIRHSERPPPAEPLDFYAQQIAHHTPPLPLR